MVEIQFGDSNHSEIYNAVRIHKICNQDRASWRKRRRKGDNSGLVDVELHEVRNSPSTYATYPTAVTNSHEETIARNMM